MAALFCACQIQTPGLLLQAKVSEKQRVEAIKAERAEAKAKGDSVKAEGKIQRALIIP